MKKHYMPELGQMAFGQPWKSYKASELLIAALKHIRDEMERVYWNNNQEDIHDPFDNTGGEYKNDTFEVQAYSWDDEKEQPYNFKWGDVEISWYKHLCRGTSVNKPMTPALINKMLNECLKSLLNEEKSLDEI